MADHNARERLGELTGLYVARDAIQRQIVEIETAFGLVKTGEQVYAQPDLDAKPLGSVLRHSFQAPAAKKSHLSPEARQRIAAAQRKRWAAKKRKGGS